MVGGRDGQDVDVLGFENLAEVSGLGGRVAEFFLRLGGELGEDIGVDVADVGDVRVGGIIRKRGEVGSAASVETADCEVDALIGADD